MYIFVIFDSFKDTSLDEAAGFTKANKAANQTVAGAPGQQGTPVVSSWNRKKVHVARKNTLPDLFTYRYVKSFLVSLYNACICNINNTFVYKSSSYM